MLSVAVSALSPLRCSVPQLGFCTAEVSLQSEDLVSPCSDPSDKQVAGGGCKNITGHDEDILTLDVDRGDGMRA